jgi:hypothetical protein
MANARAIRTIRASAVTAGMSSLRRMAESRSAGPAVSTMTEVWAAR